MSEEGDSSKDSASTVRSRSH